MVTVEQAGTRLERVLSTLPPIARRGWQVLAVGALLCVPLFVACVWLFSDQLYAPIFETAFTEMRVRDVGTRHPPLLGLSGRLANDPEIGCHPGPASFYLLAPVYRLLGASYWALRVSTAALNAAAIFAALAIVRRRVGTVGVVAVGAVLSLIMLGFGVNVLTEPWNAYLPVLWFMPFLLAVWSVLDGENRFLLLVAGLGSACGQTHIPYLALCGSLASICFVVVFARWMRARAAGRPQREYWMACAGSIVLALLIWSPPLYQELRSDRGNLTIIVEYLRAPTAPPAGLRMAAELVLQRFDVAFLIREGLRSPGVVRVPLAAAPQLTGGLVVFGVWLACAGVAMKRRDRTALTLHITVALATALGIFATSRIFGPPWMYLLFAYFSVGGLAVVAIIVTLGRSVQESTSENALRDRIAAGLALTLTVATTMRLASVPSEAGVRDRNISLQVGALAPAVAAGLRQRLGAEAEKGRYIVTAADGIHNGVQAYGVLNELWRHGFRAYFNHDVGRGPSIGAHRELAYSQATARLHFVTSGFFESARRIPGAEQIAYADPRTPEERAEYERLRSTVLENLEKIGQPMTVEFLEQGLHRAEIPSGDMWDRMRLGRMRELGAPAAVFLIRRKDKLVR